MSTNTPRVVFVTRETEYELLIARHATREQARFFLRTRGESLEDVETLHERLQATLRQGRAAVPDNWRQAKVRRADLDRFLFTPDDVVVTVGQDGLIANVAKYLDGQPVLGVNPAPDLYDGVLVRLQVERLAKLLPAAVENDVAIERRTMVEADLDSGERLLALNEIFIGHRSHQSARYEIETAGFAELQSSSGVIVASGTGATGWARSISEATGVAVPLEVEERALAYMVREPFPSRVTGTVLRAGKLVGADLTIRSRMNDGGTVFADGMEQDHLLFDYGRRLTIKPAERVLRLVVA